MVWDTENARRWIDRGQADAEALIRSPEFAPIAAIPGRFV
jgi:hypothetical protein